jgi:hypothetical protein
VLSESRTEEVVVESQAARVYDLSLTASLVKQKRGFEMVHLKVNTPTIFHPATSSRGHSDSVDDSQREATYGFSFSSEQFPPLTF